MAERAIRLSDAEYVRMFEATVVPRIDLWLVNAAGKVMLVRRRREPHADWWLPGGRFRPGNEPFEAALDQARRDLGLVLDGPRLDEIGNVHCNWGLPSYGLTAQLTCFVWAGTLESIEVSSVLLSRKYRELAWCDPGEVAEAQDTYHPDLAKIAMRALSRRSR